MVDVYTTLLFSGGQAYLSAGESGATVLRLPASASLTQSAAPRSSGLWPGCLVPTPGGGVPGALGHLPIAPGRGGLWVLCLPTQPIFV